LTTAISRRLRRCWAASNCVEAGLAGGRLAERRSGLAHFQISGSASCTISRTFASVFPRQSPSSLIFSAIDAEADSTGLFMVTSNSLAYFSGAQRNLQPPQVEASSQPLKEGRCTPHAEGRQSFFGHLRAPWKTRRISTAWPRTR